MGKIKSIGTAFESQSFRFTEVKCRDESTWGQNIRSSSMTLKQYLTV